MSPSRMMSSLLNGRLQFLQVYSSSHHEEMRHDNSTSCCRGAKFRRASLRPVNPTSDAGRRGPPVKAAQAQGSICSIKSKYFPQKWALCRHGFIKTRCAIQWEPSERHDFVWDTDKSKETGTHTNHKAAARGWMKPLLTSITWLQVLRVPQTGEQLSKSKTGVSILTKHNAGARTGITTAVSMTTADRVAKIKQLAVTRQADIKSPKRSIKVQSGLW